MAEFLKRKEKGNATANKIKALTLQDTDPDFAKKSPATAEFLSLESWDEKTDRERGTITLFWEEGQWKASVNDRDSEQTAFVTKGTFKSLLEAIEKGLSADSLDWRSKGGKGHSGKKKA